MPNPIRIIDGTAQPHEPFWRFRDVAESESGETELELFGPISEYSWWGDEVTPALFKTDLYDKGKGGPVTVLVNSPGGETIAASVIRAILQEYPGKVTADIVGLCASAATVVVTGADHVRMRESALFMIHEASALAWGTIEELKQVIEILKTLNESIVNTYQDKTHLDQARLARMMNDETWMTAREALELGFIDEVVGGSVKKAPTNVGFLNCLKNFVNVPAQLLASAQPVEPDARPVSAMEAELRDYSLFLPKEQTMDLKPYFDAARAADDEVQRILNEMNTAFGLGTDEGRQQALELRPTLDVAKDQAGQSNALYVSMRDAAQVSGGVAKNFVPVPGAVPENGAAASQSMSRADFVALATDERMKFIKNNGQLTD